VKKTPRKPYKPPAIRTEKLYERSALACGKSATTQPPPGRGQCRRNPRVS
jgi:hypothetical protein